MPCNYYRRDDRFKYETDCTDGVKDVYPAVEDEECPHCGKDIKLHEDTPPPWREK